MKSGIIINDNVINQLTSTYDMSVNLSKNALKKNIDEIINNKGIDIFIKNGEIDVDCLSDEIFPTNEEYDFFISHSHGDIKIIKQFAGYLERLNFKVFVDSEVWGSVYNLLRKIDNKICYKSSENAYSYEKRNDTTSNVFLILSIALGKVIQNSKYFIFVDSETSCKKIEGTECTYSPWLSQEMNYFNLIAPQSNFYSQFSKTLTLDESAGLETILWKRKLDINLRYCSTLTYENFREIEKLQEKNERIKKMNNFLIKNYGKKKLF